MVVSGILLALAGNSPILLAVFLDLVITGGIAVALIGLIYLLCFSRKRLWKILKNYSAGGQLSRGLKRKLRL
jgi:hypothetical protein